MQRIVLTGGPGAGKTTVLDVLREQGYATGDDAARSIIRERKAAGLTPRPDALTFAKQVFEKDVAAYQSAEQSAHQRSSNAALSRRLDRSSEPAR